MRQSPGPGEVAVANCGCMLAWIAMNLTAGAYAFDYSLWSFFAKDVPWYADVLAGGLLGQFTIPIAVGCWVARLCGVEVPFIGGA